MMWPFTVSEHGVAIVYEGDWCGQHPQLKDSGVATLLSRDLQSDNNAPKYIDLENGMAIIPNGDL